MTFPDCWDGDHTDSADHRSHMGRSQGGACPDDHPVAVPQLILDIHYPVTGARRWPWHRVRCSRRTPTSSTWDQSKLETEVRSCINRSLVCGVVSNRATG